MSTTPAHSGSGYTWPTGASAPSASERRMYPCCADRESKATGEPAHPAVVRTAEAVDARTAADFEHGGRRDPGRCARRARPC